MRYVNNLRLLLIKNTKRKEMYVELRSLFVKLRENEKSYDKISKT